MNGIDNVGGTKKNLIAKISFLHQLGAMLSRLEHTCAMLAHSKIMHFRQLTLVHLFYGVNFGRKIIPKFKTSRLVLICLVVFSVIKSHE